MNRMILMVVIGACAACTPANGSFYIDTVNQPDKSCGDSVNDPPPPQGGTLDLGVDPQYFVQLGVKSFLKSATVTGGSGLVLEPASRERVEVRKLLLSYSLTLPMARTAKTLRTDEVPLSRILEGGEQTSYLTVNLIGPRGAEDLLSNFNPAAEDPVPASEVGKLVVTAEIEARLTGSAAILRTGGVTLPIAVYRSGECGRNNREDKGFKASGLRCYYSGQDRPTRSVVTAVDCE